MNRDVMRRIETIDIYMGHRDAGYNTQPHHFHSWYEIFIITDGDADFYVYDKHYAAPKGTVMLLRPGVFHYYTSTNGCEYIVIEIAPGYINRFFTNEAADMLFECFDADTVLLEEAEILECLRLASRARENGRGSVSEKFISVGGLLSLLGGKCEGIGHMTQRRAGSDEKLNNIVYYISNHYTEIHSVTDITENCYISKTHLFRLFNRELGQHVSDYVNNLKINAARDMLVTNEKTVTEIAFECGFNSMPHFYKEFKKRLGCVPKEYIKRYR